LGHLNNIMFQAMATPGAVVCRVGEGPARCGSFLVIYLHFSGARGAGAEAIGE
jgi:hypothetical protein